MVFLVFLFCGCTSINGIKNSQGSGVSRMYERSFDEAYDAALKAIRHLEGFTIIEEDRGKGEIIAVRSMNMSVASSGERVALFLSRLNEQETKIEVVSKAIVVTQIFAPHWENQIFQLIDLQLEK